MKALKQDKPIEEDNAKAPWYSQNILLQANISLTIPMGCPVTDIAGAADRMRVYL